MKTGTVKWFNDQKGFGFILADDRSPTDRDLFVHQKSIKMSGFRSLVEGQRVLFEVGPGPDGRTQAIDVTVIE